MHKLIIGRLTFHIPSLSWDPILLTVDYCRFIIFVYDLCEVCMIVCVNTEMYETLICVCVYVCVCVCVLLLLLLVLLLLCVCCCVCFSFTIWKYDKFLW